MGAAAYDTRKLAIRTVVWYNIGKGSSAAKHKL